MRSRVTEKDVRRAFVRELRTRGLVGVKLTTLGPRGTSGWPDYLVLGSGGRVAFVELKRPGCEPTDRQIDKLDELRRRGFRTAVCDDARKLGTAKLLTWLQYGHS